VALTLATHRAHLADASRLALFDRAIHAVVRPGDVVIDLGCGTGVLGLLACRAGAARVYAIDDGGIIGLAREIAVANGCADRIVHVTGSSTRITLPERADVVISDQIGRLGFDAGIVPYYDDARRRLLKPGARALPMRVATCIAPVEAPEQLDDVEFWRRPHAGLTFDAVHDVAANTGYPADLHLGQLLSAPARLVTYDLTGQADSGDVESGDAIFAVDRDGTLHGLGGWFEAELAADITMTNAPGHRDRISRRPAFLPVARPVEVAEGDRVVVALKVRPADELLVWRVRVERGGTVLAAFDHATLRGMLISPADLARTRLDARPQASDWARARGTVIGLADGRRSLRDIERETFDRHRHLFADAAEAAAFVSTVVSQDDGPGL
jgi:protein arginine N-methyltransferase 1